MSEFADLTAGWEMSVIMQLRTPLKWLQRHREFHAGAERPTEALLPEHASWAPVLKSWRELGIDEDEVPESTMASEVGQQKMPKRFLELASSFAFQRANRMA